MDDQVPSTSDAVLFAKAQSKNAPEVVMNVSPDDDHVQEYYDALSVPDTPEKTSWWRRWFDFGKKKAVPLVPESTWFQNWKQTVQFRDKCKTVMRKVWDTLGSAFSGISPWLYVLALVLGMLWVLRKSTMASPMDIISKIVPVNKHEINYFKKMGKLPPRFKNSELEYDDDREEYYLTRRPPPLWEPKGNARQKFANAAAYEAELELFMKMDEFQEYVETGCIPPAVLDRMNPDQSFPDWNPWFSDTDWVYADPAKEESGRDIPNSLRVKYEDKKTMKVKAQMYSSRQAHEITNVVRSNHFYLSYPGKECLVLGVGGRAFLVNRHYWNQIPDGIVTLQGNSSQSKVEMKKEEIHVQNMDRTGETGDMLMLWMPKRVQQVPDIRHHFIRKKDLAALPGSYAILVTWDGSERCNRGGKIIDVKLRDIRLSGQLRKMTSILSDIRSVDGDCGGALVLDDDKFVGKICGFHYGGSYPVGALSVPLVYEDFMVYNDLNTLVPPALVQNNVAAPLHVHAQCFGSVAVAPSNPTKTSFQTTELYDNEHLEPSEMAPAYLAPMNREDGPAMRALQKVDQDVPYIDQYKLGLAAESFKENLFPWRSDKAPSKRILTFEESVQGCEFGKGINRSHSAGYPWMLKSSKGKRHWFGSDEWDVTGPAALEVKNEVERKLELMRNGQYEPALYVDTLKDETRDLERVALQKTRVFSAAPMDYIILMRMYFLAFFSFVMANRNENEVSVGTQCQSIDWHMMTERLLSNGGGFIAGDFSNFDGTLHSEILYKVLDIIQEWYDDGEENQRIRALIFEDVVHSWHITGKEVNAWNHSQPSGNPGTAIFNSMYNSLIMRMCYYDLEEECSHHVKYLDTFNRNVKMVSYGDDNVLSVNPSIDWYNQTAITRAMEKYGMTYTSETKDGSQHTFRTIEEISYLQRSFRFEPLISQWVAPLKKRSINERMYWMKKNPTPRAVLLENCRGAIAEWALHPAPLFTEWQKRIQNAMASLGGDYETWKPQLYFLEYVRSGRFEEAFPATSFA